LAAETAIAKPEEVGLNRAVDAHHRHGETCIAAGEISGGVTLVARHGKIAHFEATGDRQEPMKPMGKRRVPHASMPSRSLASAS
jgi:hypothetical protein